MVVKPKKVIKVETYGDFCTTMSLPFSDYFFEDGKTDEEMIISDLEELEGTYVVTFVNVKDGYFLITQIE